MGMGQRLNSAQTDDYLFHPPDEEFDFGNGNKLLVWLCFSNNMTVYILKYCHCHPTQTHHHIAVYHHYPNHNISSDTLAAVRVFATEGLRIDVINDAVTNKVWWSGAPCLGLMEVSNLFSLALALRAHGTAKALD